MRIGNLSASPSQRLTPRHITTIPSTQTTRDMSTQTTLLFDPYIRSNFQNISTDQVVLSNSAKIRRKSGESDDGNEDPFLFPTPPPLRTTTTTSSTTSTTSTTPTTPTTPTMRSPKIDLKNITGWNSLKKMKGTPTTPTGTSSTPSTPTSSYRHTPSPFPHQALNNVTHKFNPKNSNQTSPTSSSRPPNGNLPKPSLPPSTLQTSPKLMSPPLKPPANHKPAPPLPPLSPPSLISPSTSPPVPSNSNGASKKETTASKFGSTMFNSLNNVETTNENTSKNGNSVSTNGNPVAKSGNGVANGENGVSKFPQGPKPPAPKPIGKSKCKKVVVLPTSIDAQALTSAKTITKELGGTLASKYSEEVTHIVTGLTGAFCARRTIKYCLGVAQGKWVVPMDWLTQSQTAGHWIAEETFEVEGDSVTMGGPKSAREAIEKGGDPLFSNCQIFLVGAFTSPTKAEFKKLLQLGGAEVSAKTPTKKTPAGKKPKNAPMEALVCNPTSFSSLEKEEVERLRGLGRPVVDTRWILDCVSFYQLLPFTEYELSG